uniref:uncharacterized protein LOC109972589 n=1 Tax=Monopterus albus TaxID=43700 RepID=UPI0009B417C0|nr:uncharacterized protein LOC109972589 [Monopterus albus]
MRTKAILVQKLFMLILWISASSVGNQTYHNNTPTLSSNNKTPDSSNESQSTTPTGGTDLKQNYNITTTFLALTRTSHLTKTNQPDHYSSVSPTTNTTTNTTTTTHTGIGTKVTLFLILLAILLLTLFLGFLHHMRNRQLDQGRSGPRFILHVRERLRAATGNLENCMGCCFWPVGKRGGEDEEEEAEGREEEQEDDLKESALNRQEEEEERKQREDEDNEETSSVSEGSQSPVDEESSGVNKGGSEEIPLINSPQENEEKANLCDVTIL